MSNPIIDRVRAMPELVSAVECIASGEHASTWTRQQQIDLIWNTIALAYQTGVVAGCDQITTMLKPPELAK